MRNMTSVPTRSRDGRPEPDIISDTGVLMDADTGVVLYNKGADEQRYPASITKIMTLAGGGREFHHGRAGDLYTDRSAVT